MSQKGVPGLCPWVIPPCFQGCCWGMASLGNPLRFLRSRLQTIDGCHPVPPEWLFVPVFLWEESNFKDEGMN